MFHIENIQSKTCNTSWGGNFGWLHKFRLHFPFTPPSGHRATNSKYLGAQERVLKLMFFYSSIIPIARANGYTSIQPSACSSVAYFSRYDANILGGSLLGIGMSLTGACPGTVLPQIATGVGSSLLVGIGGIVGAIIFERFIEEQVTRNEISFRLESLLWCENADTLL